MPGSRKGGLKTTITNKALYGDDFYARIGKIGGSTPKTRPSGFRARPELASAAGRKGGLISKRGPSLNSFRQTDK